MLSKRKIFAAAASLIFLSVFAFCGDIPKNAYDGFENKVSKFCKDLFLMPEQKEAVDILTKRLKDKRKNLKAKIAEAKTQKNKALSEKDFTKAKEAVSKISAYEKELENDKIEYMKSLTVILSDEEYDVLNEIIMDEAAEKQKTKKNSKKSKV